MIQSDDELVVYRQQAQRMEDAIVSLRREVRTSNPEMYGIMVEEFADQLNSLREQIDSYLEIQAVPETADLLIALEGEGVSLGHTSVAAVTRIVDRFRTSIQSVVELVEKVNRPDTARRRSRWIEQMCDFPLVGVQPGSVQVLLASPQFDTLLGPEEKATLDKAIDLFFDALVWAAEPGDKESSAYSGLSADEQRTLVALVSQLLPPTRGDVSQVRFGRYSLGGKRVLQTNAVLTRKSRDRVRVMLERLTSTQSFAEFVGIIRRVNLDRQAFTLRTDDSTEIACEYGKELEEVVKESLDQNVTVVGVVSESQKTGRKQMTVEAIEATSFGDE